MSQRHARRAIRAALVACGALALLACGGSRPVERPSEPAAEIPAAAPAPASPVPAAAPDTAATPAPTAAPQPEPKPEPKPAPKPVTKPAPSSVATAQAPKPKPEPVIRTLVVGTELDTELLDQASSKTSKVGEVVRARVTRALVIDGLTIVPEGAILSGTITEAVPLKKIGGQASLGLKFDTLELPGGGSTPVVTSLQSKGKSETGKDAGTIAGATAGGALLGRLFSKHDKTKGTLIGAVVGAAAGTGAAAATKGQEVELPAGTPLTLHLEEAAQVTVQP